MCSTDTNMWALRHELAADCRAVLRAPGGLRRALHQLLANGGARRRQEIGLLAEAVTALEPRTAPLPAVPPQQIRAVIPAIAAGALEQEPAAEPELDLGIAGVLVGARLEVLAIRQVELLR
jgi:hypothetical protein